MSLYATHSPISRVRRAGLAACLLAGLLALAPASALADEVPVEEPQVETVEVGTAADDVSDGAVEPSAEADPLPAEGDAESDGAVDQVNGPDVVTLRLAEGTRDYGRAQAVVDAINQLRLSAAEPVEALSVDGALQRGAIDRSAETALWQSARRPSGAAAIAPVEFRFHGEGAEPAAVLAAIGGNGALLSPDLASIGVGCWEQGGERFYVVELSPNPADPTGAVMAGADLWAPEVQVDLSGRTSAVLQGRLQASGYKTNLVMVPNSTRAVNFTWVTAPEEAGLPSATDLPTIAVDPSTFTWTSSDEGAATVSPTGIVTLYGASILTPSSRLETGADITASLEGSDRALTFHVSGAVPVYRLYNPGNTAHLYTTDANEYRTLPAYGWSPEGVTWQSVWSSDRDGEIAGTPVWRLLNPTNGDHHYTSDANEYATLPDYGWQQEGVAYYSADSLDGQPVYRLFNSYQTAEGGLGAHLWTTEANEYATLGSIGWTQEGASLYGVRS